MGAFVFISIAWEILEPRLVRIIEPPLFADLAGLSPRKYGWRRGGRSGENSIASIGALIPNTRLHLTNERHCGVRPSGSKKARQQSRRGLLIIEEPAYRVAMMM
jgi:hypothetical protein